LLLLIERSISLADREQPKSIAQQMRSRVESCTGQTRSGAVLFKSDESLPIQEPALAVGSRFSIGSE